MKSSVLKTAHQLRKSFKSWSECVAYCWRLIKLRYAMFKGVVEFSFIKIDGTVRKAKGTLNSELVSYIPKTGRSNDGVFTYFDIEKNAFRCFKIQNLYFAS